MFYNFVDYHISIICNSINITIMLVCPIIIIIQGFEYQLSRLVTTQMWIETLYEFSFPLDHGNLYKIFYWKLLFYIH